MAVMAPQRQRRAREQQHMLPLLLAALAAQFVVCQAFVAAPATLADVRCKQGLPLLSPTKSNQNSAPRDTALHMYNLPPPPPSNKNIVLRNVAVGTLVLASVAASFWAGGVFFLAINAIILLSLFVPVVSWIGATVTSIFTTVEGPCPNCGAPVRVSKEPGTSSVCFNCGSLVQSGPGGFLELAYYEYDDSPMVVEQRQDNTWFSRTFQQDNSNGNYNEYVDNDRPKTVERRDTWFGRNLLDDGGGNNNNNNLVTTFTTTTRRTLGPDRFTDSDDEGYFDDHNAPDVYGRRVGPRNRKNESWRYR